MPDGIIAIMRAVGVFMAIVSTMAILFFPTKSYAEDGCQPVYGGGQTCTTSSVSVEKDVVNPATNNDVHDLGQNDATFAPGGVATFHITIRNTGSNTINGAKVVDTFPQYMALQSGPGNFNPNTGILTFFIGALLPNQAQTFTITGKILDSAHLPPNQTTCLINQVAVTNNNQQVGQDSSQFCVQNGAVPSTTSVAPPQVIQTPATGANPLLFFGLLTTGAVGFALQKIARKEHYGN